MDSNINNYHQYTYTDESGNSVHEYTGPYPVILSGGSYGSGFQAYVNCYDININAYVGLSYNGYMILPDTIADLEAAYIEKKMLDVGAYLAPASVTGPMAMAIWQIENPSSINPAPFPFDPAAAPLVQEARNAVATGAWTAADAAYYPMWIPTPLNGTQRFGLVLGRRPLAPDLAPEPRSLLFGAGGLLVFVGLLRRSKRLR